MKKSAKPKHLVNWYFGTFCYRCVRIDSDEEKHGGICYGKINLIADKIIESGIEMMTHKEFREIIKTSTFCKPIKREFHDCPICRALGVTQRM